MGEGLFAGQVVAVVGRHQRQAELAGDLDQPLVDGCLLGKEVLLQLEVEAVVVEDLGDLAGAALGIGHPPRADQGRQLAAQAGGEGDQPGVVLP